MNLCVHVMKRQRRKIVSDIDRQLEFLYELSAIEIGEDKFGEQLKLFSRYLSNVNDDYHYNETYLMEFYHDFIQFKKYVSLKNQIYIELIRSVLLLPSNYKLTIMMDQFWEYQSDKINSCYANTKINHKAVCSDQVQIKATLECENSKCTYLEKYYVIESSGLLKTGVEELMTDFQKWIGEICNG